MCWGCSNALQQCETRSSPATGFPSSQSLLYPRAELLLAPLHWWRLQKGWSYPCAEVWWLLAPLKASMPLRVVPFELRECCFGDDLLILFFHYALHNWTLNVELMLATKEKA